MRQILVNEDYIEVYLNETKNIIERSLQWASDKKIAPNKLNNIYRGLASNFLKDTISKYTFGYNRHELLTPLSSAIEYTRKSWDGFWKLKNSEGKELDQYILSAYDEMLWMLSLAYLLDLPKEIFIKLVEVIDQDNVNDLLFEFIIRAKLPERKPIQKESYREHFGVPKVFEKLRRAINIQNKGEAQELIKLFLEKEWYNNHKEAGWYNNHQNKNNTYFGYWSFETASIVKIMGLDDTDFKGCTYYPADLI